LFKKSLLSEIAPPQGFLNYEDLLKKQAKLRKSDLPFLKEKISPFDPVLIKFTCGLTGYSRGAMLTHFGLINNGLPIAKNQILALRTSSACQSPFIISLVSGWA